MRKLILLLIVALTACTPVYIPNSRPVPLFDQPGQVSIEGFVNGSGFDLNTGVSITDHFAIIADASYGKNEGSDSSDYHEHRFGEIGVGYYNNGSGELISEFFAGYGVGEGTSVDNYEFFTIQEERTTGTYNRAFFQANIGWAPGVVKLGGVARLSYVTFTKFETTSSSFNRSRTATFVEPAFFFKVGRDIMFDMQAGLNIPMSENVAFDYRFLHLTMGVGLKLGPK